MTHHLICCLEPTRAWLNRSDKLSQRIGLHYSWPPEVVGDLAVLRRGGGGLYGVVPAITCSDVAAIQSTWMLLIESSAKASKIVLRRNSGLSALAAGLALVYHTFYKMWRAPV